MPRDSNARFGRSGLTRRSVLSAGVGLAATGASALGFRPDPATAGQAAASSPVPSSPTAGSDYFPPAERAGGWRKSDARSLGMNPDRLVQAVRYHDESPVTTSRGGALVVVHQGHVVAESYVTGAAGGPREWSARTCNDMKSSTKSVFGTAVGVFLDEHRDTVTLDSLLVGEAADRSLVPQIWSQPISDPRKRRIKVKHALSMTSGHESREPWLAPSARRLSAGYRGPFQMYEYCFGWWQFAGVPAQHTLKFEPGTDFNYSNFGLELMALAMRDLSGQEVGPYLYDRVFGAIGMPSGLGDHQYRDMPYADDRELNFSDEPGWGRGGSRGCNAYGADRSASALGYNSIVGSTFRCTARDFARLAYLWLRGGRWDGRQLVPADWLQLATRRFVRDDGRTPNNYGYTFWTWDGEAGLPADLFMSRGHNLNHAFIVPSLDLVVVRQGNDNRRDVDGEPFATALIRRIVAAVGA